MKKFFNLNSAKGCKRLALTLIALIVLFSLCAQLLTTDGGRIKVEKITIDARGAALSEQPTKILIPAWSLFPVPAISIRCFVAMPKNWRIEAMLYSPSTLTAAEPAKHLSTMKTIREFWNTIFSARLWDAWMQ